MSRCCDSKSRLTTGRSCFVLWCFVDGDALADERIGGRLRDKRLRERGLFEREARVPQLQVLGAQSGAESERKSVSAFSSASKPLGTYSAVHRPHIPLCCRLWAGVPLACHTQKIHGKSSHTSPSSIISGDVEQQSLHLVVAALFCAQKPRDCAQGGACGGADDHDLPILWGKMGYTAASSSPKRTLKHSIGELPKL